MLSIALAIFIGILMPLYAVFSAWSGRRGGRFVWLLKVIAAAGFMGFLSLVARWDWLSIYLVYLWWAVVALAALLSFREIRHRRRIEGENRSALWSAAFEAVVGLGLAGYAATAFLHGPAIDLRWPLPGGGYVVHGGSNTMLNYHNSHAPQRYALDIVALDSFGRRATGMLPADLDAYVIYRQEVVSPCDGTVVAAADGMPDNPVGETNAEQPPGNHVVIACDAVQVELAHFTPDSLAVGAGDTVAAGQKLGLVGNSGNTSEPHLHIHAVPLGTGDNDEAEGVPLTFGGVFPVRNTAIGP